MQFRNSALALALASAFALTISLLTHSSAAAGTPKGGTAASPGPGYQNTPVVVSNFYGGYVAWTDRRNGGGDAWFAVLDSSGTNPMSAPVTDQQAGDPWPLPGEQFVYTKSRGPWVAYRDSANGYDIGIAHPVGGGYGGPNPYRQMVVSEVGDQVAPRVLTYPYGTVFVVWQDGRLGSTNTDIYVAGLPDALVPPPLGWPSNPAPVCTFSGNQTTPVLCSDGSGGAFVAWVDARAGGTDIYVQRVNSTGSTMLIPTGRAVCTLAGDQNSVEIISDGLGGAILAWIDYRNGNADIYAQRINAMGSPMWGLNGIPVCNVAGTQDGLVLNSDFQGGAWLAWVDSRSGQHIFHDRLNSAGSSMLSGGNGVSVTNMTSGSQAALSADSDSAGFYLAWEDRQGGDSNIGAFARSPHGGIMWDVTVCAAPGDQTAPSIAALDNSRRGGAAVAWQDNRAGATRTQIYTQRIRTDGALAFVDGDSPRLSSVRDVRNDQGAHVSLSFTGGGLDKSHNRLITEFRVWRRVAPTSAIMSGAPLLGPGADALRGKYVARQSLSAQSGATAATTYWEAIATLPAQQLEGYGFTASTLQDSVGGSNPYTAFFVTGLTSDRNAFYESNIDSSYSVDNLAPAMVQAFTGWGSPTATALHWAKSPEADFATYRVYRGNTANFAPAAANMVTEKADTGYVDVVTGSHFYKLFAVDVHGNASPAALLSPTNTTGVEGAPLSRLSLASPSPNPVRREASIHFALPRGGEVSLELFDIQGARVRTLAAGSLEAGEHVARWDGRDESGTRAERGVYFYRLATADGSLTKRLVLAD